MDLHTLSDAGCANAPKAKLQPAERNSEPRTTSTFPVTPYEWQIWAALVCGFLLNGFFIFLEPGPVAPVLTPLPRVQRNRKV